MAITLAGNLIMKQEIEEEINCLNAEKDILVQELQLIEKEMEEKETELAGLE